MITLTREQLSFFSEILTGYPEQVFFTVDMIKEHGIETAKKNSHIIQQYGSEKAKVAIDIFKDDKNSQDLIYLISRFEFLSYDVLFDIVSESAYAPLLERLFASSVCERIGSSSDYFRVNEVIRDYISRNKFGQESIFEEKIKSHVKAFINNYEKDDTDISDYIFSAQEALKNGGKIPDYLLVPSVFIKAMKQLYDEKKNYQDALTLANRILLREKSLHINTINQIRFVKCQCLARMHNSDFFTEVRKIKEPESHFLNGFYYRLSGNFQKALPFFMKALESGRRDPRILGELILVYMQSDEYGLAYDLAKENYNRRPESPINANNYFTCLIFKEKTVENYSILNDIVKKLSIDPSERAQEMVASARARLLAYYDNNEEESLDVIDAAISCFPDVVYPILTKAEIATHFNNKEKLNEAIESVGKNAKKHSPAYRTIIRYKAILLAMQGDLIQSHNLVNKELSGLTPTSLKRLQDLLNHYHETLNSKSRGNKSI
jgi:tetratricopeptide (TPR) repeat protein